MKESDVEANENASIEAKTKLPVEKLKIANYDPITNFSTGCRVSYPCMKSF